MTSDSTRARAVLHLQNGSVAISGRPILRRIDLRVHSGEFLALLGANGSGKSTLVRAMTGLLPLSGGTLDMFGSDIGDFHDWRRVGYVPQRANAVSGIPTSVWELVASGRLTRRRWLRPLLTRDRAAIHDALEVVGMSDLARRSMATLSGGQQQRALIARALAGEPELFFLDEPTAGVDLPSQEALARALGVLKDRGATVVLVAHELGPMAELVDRAVVMRDGRVAYDGRPLADHEVHGPFFNGGTGHHGHHHGDTDEPVTHDHVPFVASPVDRTDEESHR